MPADSLSALDKLSLALSPSGSSISGSYALRTTPLPIAGGAIDPSTLSLSVWDKLNRALVPTTSSVQGPYTLQTSLGASILTPTSDATVGLRINPYSATQTANLFEIRDFAGNIILSTMAYIPPNPFAAQNTVFIRGQMAAVMDNLDGGGNPVDSYVFHVRGAGAGSSTVAGQHVMRVHFMNASDAPYFTNYSGALPTSAGNFQNDSVGTAVTPISGGSAEQMNVNTALMAYSSGLGTGWNTAYIGRAENSPVNIGLVAFSTNRAASATAQNHGVWGIAQNTLGGTRIGGYFAITATEPTGVTSSALQCDNWGAAVPIFIATRANVSRFQVDQYGATTISPIGVSGGAVALTITSGSNIAVVGEVFDINYAAHTITITGSYATQRFVRFAQPTISAGTALTVTTAATVTIDGPPIAAGAGPAAITTPYSLQVTTGVTRLGGAVSQGGLTTQYNAVTTAGWGLPAIYAAGRPAAQTNTTVVLATYLVGAADGSFEISANINVTVSTTAAMTVTCTYTDEANVARTLQLQFSLLGGTWASSITTAQGNIPYESPVYTIRAKASTTISIQTAGTVTAITYTGEATIKQTR